MQAFLVPGPTWQPAPDRRRESAFDHRAGRSPPRGAQCVRARESSRNRRFLRCDFFRGIFPHSTARARMVRCTCANRRKKQRMHSEAVENSRRQVRARRANVLCCTSVARHGRDRTVLQIRSLSRERSRTRDARRGLQQPATTSGSALRDRTMQCPGLDVAMHRARTRVSHENNHGETRMSARARTDESLDRTARIP